jgi:hypothetical protein
VHVLILSHVWRLTDEGRFTQHNRCVIQNTSTSGRICGD